jgi:hypothetical protein
VVERRPGVMPPKSGPPPRQVSRSRIRARRLGVLAAVVLAALVAWILVQAVDDGGSAAPTTTAAIVQPKPFRIVFPEGFTRTDMAHRVQVVAKIAERKSHKQVRLAPATYLGQSKPRPIDGFGTKPRKLEGFLFPATYDFLRGTTSRQLVEDQLAAFHQNWAKVNLSYARKKNLTPYDVLIIASLVEKEALAPDAHESRHRRDDALRTARAGDEVAHAVRARELEPVQHAQPEHPRAAADADRESGSRVDASRCSSGGR